MMRKLITAFEKIIIRHQLGMIDPVTNRISRLLGDLKLNRLPRLLLHHHSSSGYGRTMSNISHSNLDEITASQFAVDGKIEKCQVTDLMGDLIPSLVDRNQIMTSTSSKADPQILAASGREALCSRWRKFDSIRSGQI